MKWNSELGTWERILDKNGRPKFVENPYNIGFAGSSGGGYAKGSPNVFNEETGRGDNVTVHEDEAVVPLPDGRRVPVVLSGRENIFADMRRDLTLVLRDGNAATGSTTREQSPGKGGISVNGPLVQMTVVSPDPSTFRASKLQIEQDMASSLEYAMRVLGKARRADDPTRRLSE